MQNKRALFGRKINDFEELKDATDRAIGKGLKGEPYEVVREVILSNEEFKILCNDFLEDQPWIEKSDGGMNENGEIRCIRLTNELTGEKILCNTEGYDYCRYVAIEGEEIKDEQ